MGTAPHILMAVQDEVLQRIEADSNSEVDLRKPESALPRGASMFCMSFAFFCVYLYVQFIYKQVTSC